jgi:predicted transposase/invertase (TIGR01784 family)
MNKKRLNPLNDYLFMRYMGEQGDEEHLLAFLNAVLHKTGKDKLVKLKIKKQVLMDAKCKYGISSCLFIHANMNNGSKVNLYLQVREVGEMTARNLSDWAIYYGSDMHEKPYSNEYPSVIPIIIVGVKCKSSSKIQNVCHFAEDISKITAFDDAFEMHLLDMLKFQQLEEKDIVNNSLYRWLSFFDKNTDFETIEKMTTIDPAIKKAHDKFMSLMQDKNTLDAYNSREKELTDFEKDFFENPK